jgi:hypothetical protein
MIVILKFMLKWFALGVLCLSLGFFYYSFSEPFYKWVNSKIRSDHTTDANTTSEPVSITAIQWEQLGEFNYKTGVLTDFLKKINGTKVRIPGFFVPLADDFRTVTEFLLVPNAQACIHVPPPPPNLIVHVKLDTPINIENITNPTWVEGFFKIEKIESVYGMASYLITSADVEAFEWETYDAKPKEI